MTYTRKFSTGNTIRLLKLDMLQEMKDFIGRKNLTKDDVKLVRRDDFVFLIALKDLELEYESWQYLNQI